jgi:hypothetical protein
LALSGVRSTLCPHIDAYIRTIDVDSEDFDDSISLSVTEIGAVPPPDPLDLLGGLPRPAVADPLPETFVQPGPPLPYRLYAALAFFCHESFWFSRSADGNEVKQAT